MSACNSAVTQTGSAVCNGQHEHCNSTQLMQGPRLMSGMSIEGLVAEPGDRNALTMSRNTSGLDTMQSIEQALPDGGGGGGNAGGGGGEHGQLDASPAAEGGGAQDSGAAHQSNHRCTHARFMSTLHSVAFRLVGAQERCTYRCHTATPCHFHDINIACQGMSVICRLLHR